VGSCHKRRENQRNVQPTVVYSPYSPDTRIGEKWEAYPAHTCTNIMTASGIFEVEHYDKPCTLEKCPGSRQ
jgi:hypothetical protein